jgi:tryptophanyl-tRNA synthetase
MAADILLYDATHVPVGDDQKQHLELCRDIAKKFNNDFNVVDFFKIPEPLIQKEFSRIMSLKDGVKKMSKSEISDLSRINLTDKGDQIVNKIKKAKTDTLPIPSSFEELKERPEAKNLINIYSSVSELSLEKTIQEFSGKNFSQFKDSLSQILVDKIVPLSKEIKKLLNEKNYLDEILSNGCKKASEAASQKIEKIHKIIGF